MLQHISDESFFNMALDALSNGLKYAKNLVFSGLSKWNQGKNEQLCRRMYRGTIKGVGIEGYGMIRIRDLNMGKFQTAITRHHCPYK